MLICAIGRYSSAAPNTAHEEESQQEFQALESFVVVFALVFWGGWMTAWVSSPWYLKTPLNIYSFSFPLDAYLWWACFALTIDMTEKLSAASVDLYAHPSYEYLWELKRPRRLIILLFRLTLVISVHSIAKLDVLVLAVLPDAFLANGNSSFINC